MEMIVNKAMYTAGEYVFISSHLINVFSHCEQKSYNKCHELSRSILLKLTLENHKTLFSDTYLNISLSHLPF